MNALGFFLPHSLLLLFITLSPIGLATTSILGNETDRLALLAFKARISQDPKQVMSSWNDSFHFCEWSGVTCSRRHQRVLILNLRSQGLVGSLSPHIGNLSFLTKIILEKNNFQEEIPQEVGRLYRLQEFNVSNNSFVGEIPSTLSHCSNLRSLHLGFNKLSGKIPNELGSLSKLVLLDLQTNYLIGGIPSSFGNLSSLEIFSLARNNLDGSIPDSLGQLKTLKECSLAANMFSGTIPSSFYNISSFEIFSVAANQIVGILPFDIGFMLPNLHQIFIGGNHFSGSIPVSLFNASGLETIDFGQCNFSGDVPINVGSLKGLQYLGLAYNNLGSGKANDLNFLNSLTNCTHLWMFDIFGNNFGGSVPNTIANLSSQLNELYLGGNQISGNIPSGIENLFNLYVLGMELNFFSGTIPNSIGMLQNLQVLLLYGNKFSGQIPSSLGNMSRLYRLKLSNNILEGNIISDLGKCHFLQILDLSENSLNGSIPKQIFSLSSQLISIKLAHNYLVGSLPLEVGRLKTLEKLDVAHNKLFGQIPSTLGSCSSLEYLYLQDNFFRGSIPSSFSSLKGIRVLDLSHNNLSGQIPKDLAGLALENLNVSFNDLEGEVPIKGVFQNASAFSIVGNNKLCGGILELQLPACLTKKSKKRGISFGFKVGIGVLILSSIVLASFLLLYWRRRKLKMKSSSTPFLNKDWYVKVSYGELHKATDGFSSSNLIGMGNFGTVYKGVLDKKPIAVKVLNLMKTGASKSFMAECKVLRKVRHRNLLKIITSCSSLDFKGDEFKALIFEFMPYGSLENWLHPSSDEQKHASRNLMNCRQRLNIAIDIASALDYLHNHCQTPVVHCDLKPSNVLLDNDMTAHVADFGLAKFLTMSSSNFDTNDISSIAIMGTIGYIPPEYGMGVEVSIHGDTYSYGILLLEMFTGKRPSDDTFKDGLNLHQFCKMALTVEQVMDILDPLLLLEEASTDENKKIKISNKMQECLVSVIRIGVACSKELLGERMSLNDVLLELHAIMEMFLR